MILSASTRFEPSAVSIEYKQIQKNSTEVVSLETLSTMAVGKRINTEAYVHASTLTSNLWTSAISGKLKSKGEIVCNGQTLVSRIVLWENALPDLKVDGTYLLSNFKASMFTGDRYLGSTNNSTFTSSENSIPKVGGIVFEKKQLPSHQVTQVEVDKKCLTCRKELQTTKNLSMLQCVCGLPD